MNCCDEYGDCQQSDTCPIRTGKVLPHQAAHAQRVARIKSTRPGWMDGKACAVPPEAGNVRLPPIDYDDGQPLSHAETMALVRLMVYLLLGVIVFFGGLSLAVNYSTERWADVLWAVLQGVS
jgi:hypothetical protein